MQSWHSSLSFAIAVKAGFPALLFRVISLYGFNIAGTCDYRWI